ncbi:MAG: DASS family sodium-coupled anion symporter [Gammaproteobacteria bacterium]|nr:DASS family sodium-coupled anion symporter [Gammaproteobacteria bacterium]
MLTTTTRRIASLLLGLVIWFTPVPAGLDPQAWQLFAIFAAVIFSVISGALPIVLASILGLVAAVMTATLEPRQAYAGFGEGLIWLIVAAFLVGRGVINSGLGYRVAYLLVRRFGSSSLGLGYSLVATDALIAPAFVSNTARSGVLFPIVCALAESNHSRPEDGSRRHIGAYLTMTSMAGLALSSGLWLTAMGANPIGVALAAGYGIKIDFGSWFLASSVPTITAMLVVPWMLYRVFPPELKATPHAPIEAQARLDEMGPLSRKEWTTLATVLGLVGGWAFAGALGIDTASVALLGFAVLMLGGVFTLEDLRKSGGALEILIWFAILFTMSSELNRLGFMSYLGDQLAGGLVDLPWPLLYTSLIVIYVLIHYLFVSQTAQLLALFGVFLSIAVPHVPGPLIAMMLLLATNFFSVITPQGSSCNVILAGSGYVTSREIYKYGGLITLANLVIYLVIGTPWILFVLD